MKELKGVDENTEIYCGTSELEMDVLIILEQCGIKWNSGDLPTKYYGKGCYLIVKNGLLQYGYSDKTITAAEFIRLNTPKIPERWCVRRTPENAEILNAWANSRFHWTNHHTEKGGYIYYDGKADQEGSGPCEDCTIITFDQWQTIPEVAEWLFNYYVPDTSKRTEKVEERDEKGQPLTFWGGKVEEREIIGWKFKEGLSANTKRGANITAGYEASNFGGLNDEVHFEHNSSAHDDLKEAGVLELWFDPVYAEKPVFKVGDTVKVIEKHKDDGGKMLKVINYDSHLNLYQLSNYLYYIPEVLTLCTPEEIEAARPKRKYMKQVWYVLVMDKNLQPIATSEAFYSEQEANEWVLRVSEEGRVYSVKPFEVVAYE